jgi:hypothetical protein
LIGPHWPAYQLEERGTAWDIRNSYECLDGRVMPPRHVDGAGNRVVGNRRDGDSAARSGRNRDGCG